ncbi:MAG TPA: hypothetical protein VE734_09565 [Terriglobales bacterium]|nr:hypothetical protein [Terriglobales bacterium]
MVGRTTSRGAAPLLAALLLSLLGGQAWGAATITVQTSAGGATVAGTAPNFNINLGTVNGLGIGSPGSGVSIITTAVSNGALYTSPYSIFLTGWGSSAAVQVTAYVSTNFAHPAVLVAKSCATNTSCSVSTNFTTVSTSSSSPTLVTSATVPNNSTVTATIGTLVGAVNGASAFTGTDWVTLTYKATDLNNTSHTATATFTPNMTEQTAVQLTLASAPSGLTISPASDYSTNYGSVNGLGISPASGLSVVSASGGVIYTTPYVITPSFSNFTSTSGTVKAYVSSNFAHAAILALEDATASGGPYTAISTSSGSPSVFTTSAASATALTRYLGLFTSNANGASAFTGADTATLTYTLTVP